MTAGEPLDGDVRRIVADLQDAGLLDGEADAPVFNAPWQARAFGLAVTLHRQGRYEWPAFQERLIEEVGATPTDEFGGAAAAREETYYRQWLAALERLLVEEGILSADEVEQRAGEFADGTRDAAEFVVGEHGHGHDHGHHHHDH
jgi:nitrile hydratase accessory protein